MPRRNSMRLQNYDYSSAGYYFVTLCCYQRQHLLGSIDSEGLWFPAPKADEVSAHWNSMPTRYSNLKLHHWVMMPNHFHAIVEFTSDAQSAHLSQIIGVFKSLSSRCYWPQKLWQRGYYDHVIRTEQAYLAISEYIQNNPRQWQLDCFYSQ